MLGYVLLSGLAAGTTANAQLNENCVVNILNRTIQVSADGGWSLPNVPSNQGRIRARATCVNEDGTTTSGQSDYFNVTNNGITLVGEIVFANLDPIPSDLTFASTDTLVLDTIGATAQGAVTATYPDGSQADVTAASSGINYSSTNAAVISVSVDGLITAVGNGFALSERPQGWGPGDPQRASEHRR